MTMPDKNTEVEKYLVVHSHNSIHGYFDGADEGCKICHDNLLVKTMYYNGKVAGLKRAVGEDTDRLNFLIKHFSFNDGLGDIVRDWTDDEDARVAIDEAITKRGGKDE